MVTQQGLVLVFDRAWLEPILRAQWQAFVTALAQNDLATAAGLVEITRRENFEPWRALLSPQQWQRVAAFFSARPLGWVGLHGYLATFQLGSESEEIGIEFTPDQGDGRWRYYLRDALLLGAVLATEH